MIFEVGGTITTIVLFLMALASAKPTSGSCPKTMYVATSARDGYYTCERRPLDDLDDNHGGKTPPGILTGRVYCTGGSVPIVVSDRIVSCQMR